MTEPSPVRPYLQATPQRLYGLVPVAEVLATYCEARWFGLEGSTAAEVISRVPADMLDEAEAEILVALRTGSLRAWAVPRNDGHKVVIKPEMWGTEDALRHLVAGTGDPAPWSIPDAPPTHWIVVEAAGLEETLAQLFPGDDDMRAGRFGPGNMPRPIAANAPVDDPATALATSTQASISDAPARTLEVPIRSSPAAEEDAQHQIADASSARSAPRRFIKLKDVMERCGLSRTRIYEKMKQDTFPKPVRLGEQTTRWYEDQVDEWIAAPR